MMPRRKPGRPGLVIALAAAAVLVLLAVVFRSGLSALLWQVAGPVVSFRNSFNNGEVGQLQAQLASTSASLAKLELLEQENAQLRAQLGRAGGTATILAGVLQGPPGTPYDTLLVDAGSGEGVVAGARVSAGGLEVGAIDAVYPHTARVALYSSPGESYQALLITTQGALPVAVEGQGAGSMSARVPAGTAALVGQQVVFSGLAAGLVGRVSAVSAAEGDSFKTVYLQLPVNPFELREVYIQK